MSMNKAEREEMESLKRRLALAWPPAPPKPVDVAVALAGTGERWFRGWWFNRASKSVGLGMTNGSLSSREAYTDEQLDNRYRDKNSRVSLAQGNGGPWFSTEADALRALHYAVAEDCADLLYYVSERVRGKELQN